MKKMKLYYGLTTLFLLILLIAIFGLQTFCFERKEMNLPVLFLILIMLSNPIKNLFCVRQKIVKNSIYHGLWWISSIYLFTKTIASILLFFMDGKIATRTLFYGVDTLVLICLFIGLNISGLFLKKEESMEEKNSITFIYIGLLLFLLPSLIQEIHVFTKSLAFSFGNLKDSMIEILYLLAYLYLLNNARNLYKASDLRKKAFIMAILSIFLVNIPTLMSSIYLLFNSEQFLLND